MSNINNEVYDKVLRHYCNNLVKHSLKKIPEDSVKRYAYECEKINLLQSLAEHFDGVAKQQKHEVDSILGYDDMVDYAKWYLSNTPII